MNAQEIIDYIANSEKKTPVKLYVNTTAPLDFGSAQVFGSGNSFTVFGDWAELQPILEAGREKIADLVVENDRRNSGVPLLDLKGVQARIEPGAIIREKVEIGQGAVIMMGAVLNIGAVVGPGTMIDMGAVLGGRATVGARCHIGAGAGRRGGARLRHARHCGGRSTGGGQRRGHRGGSYRSERRGSRRGRRHRGRARERRSSRKPRPDYQNER